MHSALAVVDDALYAGVIASLGAYIMDDPALAAALAAGVVLLVRGLGILALQAGQYLRARAYHIRIEAERLRGSQGGPQPPAVPEQVDEE